MGTTLRLRGLPRNSIITLYTPAGSLLAQYIAYDGVTTIDLSPYPSSHLIVTTAIKSIVLEK